MRNIVHDTSPTFLLNTPQFSLTKCREVLSDYQEIEEIRMMGSMVSSPVLARRLQFLMVIWGRAGLKQTFAILCKGEEWKVEA